MSSDQPSAATIWQTAYGELQLQMPRETFDTWLRSARLLAHEDGTYIIGVKNIYAREWLEHRLKKLIMRTLSQVAGRSVEVRFVVWSDHEAEVDLRSAGPLMAALEPPPAERLARFETSDTDQTGLNPRYTFENYAVGVSNRLAHAAAVAIVEDPASRFNPLYLHANVGLGKTHLLHAIGNACGAAGLRTRLISAERFTNDLMAALHSRKMADYREKYRSLDVLLVDDIEFIAGKDSTQEEFYHTFNKLHESDAQIVVVSNLPPGGINRLDTRLRSRFEGGLVVEIGLPDFETRMAILLLKTRLRGLDGQVPYEVLEVIAGESQGSVRELEGAFNRLIATSLLTHEAPTVHLAEAALNDLQSSQLLTISIGDVILAVTGFYEIDPVEMTGRGRSREVSAARQIAMYLAYKETSASLQQIGEALGGRNHSTVLYSCERIDDLMGTDSQVQRDVQMIRQMLRPQNVPQTRAHRDG